MEGIKHRLVIVNGIKIHIAEKGEGPVVLFLHGFPELWYTWRHQVLALSSLGYHAVAPDLRGYGDSEAPRSSRDDSSYTCLHIVGDLIALIDFLGVEQVFVVGHDWGAIMAWYFCLFRPERIKAFVCLGMPYLPRDSNTKPLETLRASFGDDYYIVRFQEPVKIEEEIARVGTKEILTRMMSSIRIPGPGIMPKEDPFGPPEFQLPLPSYLSEEDINYYATKYDQTGFSGALNYYRTIDLNWELTATWTGMQVKVPVKFVVGEFDIVYTTPGVKDYVHNGDFKKNVPCLEEIVVIEDAAHCINQERPDEISSHIYDFINKF